MRQDCFQPASHHRPTPTWSRVSVLVVLISVIVCGIVGAAIWATRSTDLREERKLEWQAVITAFGAVKDWAVEQPRDRRHSISAADVDALVRVVRDARRSGRPSSFAWMMNPSPEDWSAWLAGETRNLLAVVDTRSGEIAFLWDGYQAIRVDGDSMVVDYDANGELSISSEGARRQIEGWVRVDP